LSWKKERKMSKIEQRKGQGARSPGETYPGLPRVKKADSKKIEWMPLGKKTLEGSTIHRKAGRRL